MKLCKWHTLVFRCPTCGKGADYAAEIVEGPLKGSLWDPAYWCEQCNSALRARDKWLFGAAFGPLMAMVGTFAAQAIPPGLNVGEWAACAFAIVCCAVVGWPVSRVMSRYLVYWEPRDPGARTRLPVRPLQKDDE